MQNYTFEEYVKRLQKEGLAADYHLCGQGKRKVCGITYDSRQVEKDSLFLCKGAAFREEYLAAALKKGAVGYVCDRRLEAPEDIPYIIVKNIRKAQAVLGTFFYGDPQKRLCLTGITGTKGKTTTAYYLKAILDEWLSLKENGKKDRCGLISTIRTWDGREDKPSVMTTPEALELYRHFYHAAECQMKHMVMEVSSQALKYQRVRGLEYQVGIFLNISEDHISPEEHTDFEDYFSSKLSVFRQVKTACVNLDSRFSDRILSAARLADQVITFGTRGTPDIRAGKLRKEGKGISFLLTTPDYEQRIHLSMPGIFNVENALAAIAAAYAYRVPPAVIARALEKVQVAGRMEQYTSLDGKITAIVDYAHNRLSFERLYDSVIQEFSGYTIYTVFGCPGGKAFNRRRELGLISGLFSSKVFLTADDPGNEDAGEIAAEVGKYLEVMDCPFTYIENRARAIRSAIACAAAKKDGKAVVLVLGKGHEMHQKFGSRIYGYPSDAVLVKESVQDYNTKTAGRKRKSEIDEYPRNVYTVTYQ